MATEIIMPKLGMVMTEGTVSKWNRGTGEKVAQGEVIAEIETEKINYELEATDSGVLHHVAGEGAVVAVNGLMGYLLADGEKPPAAPAAAAPGPREAAPGQAPARRAPARAPGGAVPSTPGARRLAAKLGVDISQVTPTGPRGRVVEADVRGFAESAPAPGSGGGSTASLAGLPEPAKVEEMAGMRRAIADHMRASVQSTAQLTFSLEVPVTELQRRRKEWSRANRAPVTNTHLYAKACAIVLAEMPALNTVLADGRIHHFDRVDIGIAVSLDDGLIVPVLRDVGNTPLAEVAKTTSDLTKRAQAGGLSPDEVAGGTFTISVLGTVDVFTPILSSGQSAILGVGGTRQRPVVEDGEVVIRDVCTFNLTVDHQTVDGAAAAAFMARFAELVRDPGPLLP